MCRKRHINLAQSALFHAATVMIIAAMIVFAAAGSVGAAPAIRVLVIPFTVNAGQDLAFLQHGITQMLVTRLGQADKVNVVAAARPEDDIAALVKKHRADYVVVGSITVLGDSVSTDSRVIKAAQVDSPVLSFGRTGRHQANVIDHIDELAGQINTQILGRKKIESSKTVAVLPVVPPPATDRAMDKPAIQSTPSASGARRPLFSDQDAKPLVPMPLQGIGAFNEQLNGLAAGDLDGDGAVELVTIGDSRLYAHRLKQGRWIKMAEYDGIGKFIGVDMADVNGNGRKEIFVTNFDNTEGRVISFVMEWNGKSLQRIAGQLPWYFRAVDLAGRGKVLVGQKQNLGNRFTPGIYEMTYQAGKYGPGDRLPLPRKLNVFGFAYGAVRSPDKSEAITYNPGGYIALLDRRGGEALVSTETYGGGSNTIVFNDEDQYDVQDYIYLSPRIHLHDLDGDGIQEMLVINNENSVPGGGTLVRRRYYKKGRIEWLGWHGGGIRSTMQSLDVARFIADCALVDIDGNGDLEIVAAVVKTTRSVTTKGSSYLTVFKNEPGTTVSK